MKNSRTIDECFAEIIKDRGWYKNTGYNRATASLHKQKFLEGTLKYELKRIYLEAKGYKIIQEELWKKTENDEKK